MSADTHFSHVETGIRSLDVSHHCFQFVLERLFHPQVMCAVQGGTCARIKDTMRFLVRNLEREERLMREAGYSGFNAHRREHERLFRALRRMERSLICGAYDNQDVADFLTDWMNRHVARFDKPFGEFLRTRNGSTGN